MAIINAKILLRKAFSLFSRARLSVSSALAKMVFEASSSVSIGKYFSVDCSCEISATDGGCILIGDHVSIGSNVKLIARGGVIVVGSHAFIGDGVRMVAQSSITIGPSSLVAEYVVIRDQDHSLESRPIKDAGFRTSPIVIGSDVWIGTKASVLRGGEIGGGSVVGAHSLVRGVIPANVLAVGVPARVVKNLRV